MAVTTPSEYQVGMLESRHIIMSLFTRVCTLSHALVDDVDGDEVRCRWARSSNRECAGVCNAFPGAILDQVCTYVYAYHMYCTAGIQ